MVPLQSHDDERPARRMHSSERPIWLLRKTAARKAYTLVAERRRQWPGRTACGKTYNWQFTQPMYIRCPLACAPVTALPRRGECS